MISQRSRRVRVRGDRWPLTSRLFADSRVVTMVCLVAIIALPLSLLWYRPHAYQGEDYYHSHWMVGYLGHYLKLYHHPALVYQTSVALGMAFPVLYGPLLFRLLGIIATLCDPGIAIRVAATVAVTLETLVVFRAARRLGGSIGIALLIGLCVPWSTYQLTNLYNRGDLAEFIGVTLVTTALGAWYWSLAPVGYAERWLARCTIAASLTLLGGTHAISLVFGGSCFFFVALATLVRSRSSSAVITLGVAAVAVAAGGTIFVVDYCLVGHALRFANGAYSLGFTLYNDRIDAPFARFSPFPLDPATLDHGLAGVSTPYLEASIDYAPLIFAGGTLIWRRSPLVITFVALAVLIAGISVWPWFWDVVPAPLHFFQFPYRLTAYVNIMSLCAALGALWSAPQSVRRVAGTPLPWIAATVALIAVLVKLDHANAVTVDRPPSFAMDFMDGAPMSDVAGNYTIRPIRDGVPRHVEPPLVAMAALGQPLPQRYTATRDGLIFTRILALPWNDITVDGKPLALRNRVAWNDSYFYAIAAAPGSVHQVQTTFSPPPIVGVAIRIAQAVLVLEIGGMVATLGWLIRQRRWRDPVGAARAAGPHAC